MVRQSPFRIKSTSARRLALSACLVASVALIAACEPVRKTHGYAPQESDLAKVVVGTDGKAQVAGKIGRPTTTGAFDDNEWFYITRSTETRAFLEPRVVSQEVVVVAFDNDGIASSVDRFGVQDGKVVNLVTRITPTRGKRLTFIQQLLGNIGRFSAETFTGDKPGL